MIDSSRCAPRSGALDASSPMAWRIVLVTLTRAFSAGEPVRRGLPPSPVARLSSAINAWRSALRSACRLWSSRSAASSILSERLPIQNGAGVGGGERLVAEGADQRQRGDGLVGPRQQLAEMPQ